MGSSEIWVQRTAGTCTWATEGGASAGDYSIVLPYETGAVLTLKLDYTLESIDGTGEMTCKKFMDFSGLFYTYAKNLYHLDAKLSKEDFVRGFRNMNINSYIRSLPQYRRASQIKNDGGKFDYVDPIIILEGMKFYDEILLPKLIK